MKNTTTTTSTADNQSFFIYQDATDRFNYGTSSPTDELIIVLWEEVQDQAAKIREQALKITYLEMENETLFAAKPAAVGVPSEYEAMIARMGIKKAADTTTTTSV